MSRSRGASQQPGYDFLTGSTNFAPSDAGSKLRQSINGTGNDKLRVEVKALQYELSTLKADREVNDLRQQADLAEAQRVAEEEGSRAVTLASETRVAVQKFEKLSREHRDAQLEHANDKQDLEQKLRHAQDQARTLEEELEESRTELSSAQRQLNYKQTEFESKGGSLQQTCDSLQTQLAQNKTSLEAAQAQLDDKSKIIGELEKEILTLKSAAGDQDVLATIKNELSEQVRHIQKLESTNREQSAELKKLRHSSKSVEVVEEQKRGLESKVRMMDDLRKELSENKLQRQILEEERSAWASYLENESSSDTDLKFSTPEDMARALVNERVEKISLLEKIGAFEPELSEKDAIIKSLETDITKLKLAGDKGVSTRQSSSESRKLARVERQLALANKEIAYLRAQLQTFDAEENTFQPSDFDKQRIQRISELEKLVDNYRTELDAASKASPQSETSTLIESTGNKRNREEEPDERLGQLSRKNRKLQDDLSTLKKTFKVLENDLAAQKSLVKSHAATSKTRVLELRSNPTADAVAIKAATLKGLKEENAALLAQLEGSSVKSVPISTLDGVRRDLSDMQKIVAEKEKRMTRLKQIWSSKALEFREAVASVLGWKMDFMPNGRVKVTSMFHHSDSGEDGPGEENSIIFDGENGTMKISGGPNSKFALEIKEQIRFWVEGRKEIPCFLAACTLEFYEKTTRALRI